MKPAFLTPVKWQYGSVFIEYIAGEDNPYYVYYFEAGQSVVIGCYDSFEEAFGDVKLFDIVLRIGEEIETAIKNQSSERDFGADATNSDENQDLDRKILNEGIELGLKKAQFLIEHNYFPKKAQSTKP